MTMTLNLTEEQERVLRAAAAEQQTSPEDVVRMLIGTLGQNGASHGEAHRERVRLAGEYVQQKNAELYERLA